MNLVPSGSSAATARPEDLAPFEHLMFVDARPGFPMCFFVECVVAGPLSEIRFRQAVMEAARRHRLLRSRVSVERGRPRWLPPDVSPAVIWNPHTGNPWEAIDIARASGVRLVVIPVAPDRHRVVMQVHHSACDGIAACEYFGDIWAAYAGIAAKPFAAGRSAAVGTAKVGSSINAGSLLEFARFRPTPLARRLPAAPEREALWRQPPYETLRFDAAFTDRLRTAAGMHGVTVNDALVAAVMRAAVAWNAAAGWKRSDVRITMPVNLRAAGSREPARNAIGYAFLDRSLDASGGFAPLAESINGATKWVLGTGAAASFLTALARLARRPFLLKAVTRLPVCCATAVFSNVGDASRRMRTNAPKIAGCDAPGDLVIEQFLGVPPLRPRTRAAVGGTTYAGGLALSCLCAAPDGRSGAASFLSLIRGELETFAAEAS